MGSSAGKHGVIKKKKKNGQTCIPNGHGSVWGLSTRTAWLDGCFVLKHENHQVFLFKSTSDRLQSMGVKAEK